MGFNIFLVAACIVAAPFVWFAGAFLFGCAQGLSLAVRYARELFSPRALRR